MFITASHTEHTYEAAFEIAKKFNSKITFLKCIVKPPPKFGFFSTKGEKEEHKEELEEAKKSLAAIDELAKKFDISINSDVASIESFKDYLVPYIESNHVELLIMDSHSIDEAEHLDHKERITGIFKSISCPILTLK